MDEKRLFEVKFELKEVSGGPLAQPVCHVEIGEFKQQLYIKSPVVMKSLELTPNTSVFLTLANYETVVGSTKISLGALFGEALQGKINKWLKFKSDVHPNLKAKIAAVASKVEKPKVKKNLSARKSLKNQPAEIRCPYLEKLAGGNADTTQPLDDLWKNRNFEGQNSIKISIEPDSPARTEDDDFEFTPEHIDSLTAEQLHSMTGINLKKVLRILCEEAKHLEFISLNLPVKKDELNSKVQERRRLEKWAQTEIGNLKNTWADKKEIYDKTQAELREKKEKLIEAQENQERLETGIDNAKYELVLQNTLGRYQSTLNEALRKKSELQNKLNKAREDIKNSSSKTQSELKQILDETAQINSRTKSIDQEYLNSHNNNVELRQKINALKAQLQEAHSVKEKVASSHSLYKTQEETRQDLNESLLKLVENLKKQDKEISENTKSLLSNNKNSSQTLKKQENDLETQEHHICLLQKNTYDSISKKVSQEQICCIRADMSHLIEDLNSLDEFHKKSSKVILPDLEAGSKILTEESEKIFAFAERLNEMIDQVDKKEEELDSLKNAMGEIKKRAPPYVPAKDDPVDIALAEYLNALESPVLIKFIRQDGGNYLFGSKKIYIKFENNRIVVKVGGGFTSIDEFLSVYTPIEIEKAESSPKTSAAMGNSSQIVRKESGLSPGKEGSSRSPRKN